MFVDVLSAVVSDGLYHVCQVRVIHSTCQLAAQKKNEAQGSRLTGRRW
jgi:hypothetical protein